MQDPHSIYYIQNLSAGATSCSPMSSIYRVLREPRKILHTSVTTPVVFNKVKFAQKMKWWRQLINSEIRLDSKEKFDFHSRHDEVAHWLESAKWESSLYLHSILIVLPFLIYIFMDLPDGIIMLFISFHYAIFILQIPLSRQALSNTVCIS